MAGSVRQPIDIASLGKYIDDVVPDIRSPVTLKQFSLGQSNPTYQLTDASGVKFVLRKKPPGQLLSKTAHQVEREYAVLRALQNTDVPVPKVYCLCEDSDVIGTPFYIMEFLDGRIFDDPALPGVSRAEQRQMWKAAVDTLAKLHSLSPQALGLDKIAKQQHDFYRRQLQTFNNIHQSQAKATVPTTDMPLGCIPHYDRLSTFFNIPSYQPPDRSAIVHGDYKIDNLVYHKSEPRIIGVLDWELATIGHPLSDLVNLVTPYTIAAAGGSDEILHRGFLPGACPGLPSKNEIISWYGSAAGWNPGPMMMWGDAFCLYRASIIMQGIAARQAMRVASSARSQEYVAKMRPFAEISWSIVQKIKSERQIAKF